MHHLLSIIQALLEATWLCARRLPPAKEWVNSNIFESGLEFSKGIFTNQPRSMAWNNKVSNPGCLWASNRLKRKLKNVYIIAASWVTNCRIYSLKCFLLTWTILYQYLCTKDCKPIYTYHQAFCCPESVNTKQENPKVYSANFTRCVCTGYCENWILSSLSFFIISSWE